MTQCFGCGKDFPADFEQQQQWLEVRKATGGVGVFFCPSCAQRVGLLMAPIERPPRWFFQRIKALKAFLGS
jgi:sulfur relay (sulfurtransferase) complex TusBCD TusD component (DsrE family)